MLYLKAAEADQKGEEGRHFASLRRGGRHRTV